MAIYIANLPPNTGCPTAGVTGDVVFLTLSNRPTLDPDSYVVSAAPPTSLSASYFDVWLTNFPSDTFVAVGNSGSIVLNTVQPLFTGTFTTTLQLQDGGFFDGGSTLSGKFSAPVCP